MVEGGDGGGGDGLGDEGGGGEGSGAGGLGDGGGGDGEGGGTGQAVWQTYFCAAVHGKSFHVPVLSWKLNDKQSSTPALLLGSSDAKFQLKYDSGVLDGLHTHVPSDAASVPPIHKFLVPPAVASSNAFCSADCTLASCRPAAWQAASASAQERASLMSV